MIIIIYIEVHNYSSKLFLIFYRNDLNMIVLFILYWI